MSMAGKSKVSDVARTLCVGLLAVLGFNGFAFGEEVEITPYLQNVTKNSVVVRWITAELKGGVVGYGLEGKTDLHATEEAKSYVLHEVPLAGLEAGKAYTYTVESGGQTFTGKFRTAPEADQPFTFAVWGDNRTHPDKHKPVADQMAKHQIDLAISVGDIVTRGRDIEEYKKEFFDPGQHLFRNVPFFVAVGNHEYGMDKDLDLFRSVLTQPGNERYFAFTYGNSRFVILDSNDRRNPIEKQLDWLLEEFKSKAYQEAEFHFLFLHHAPYCWDWYGGEKKIEEAIVPLAEKYMVDVFFGGHFHCYERGMKTHNGFDTYYVVTGGGGGEFTRGWGEGAPKGKQREFMTVHDWKYHFVLLTVEGRTLHYIAKDKDGLVMDEFTIRHKIAKRWPEP